MIGCVDFSKFGSSGSNQMLESFKLEWKDDKYVMIDNENQTIWFLWNR